MIFPERQELPEVSAAKKIRESINGIAGVMLAVFNNNYNLVWHNDDAAPDQVVAAMGTEAIRLFTLSAAMAQLLNLTQPGCVPEGIPEGYTYVKHQDGGIKVSKV